MVRKYHTQICYKMNPGGGGAAFEIWIAENVWGNPELPLPSLLGFCSAAIFYFFNSYKMNVLMCTCLSCSKRFNGYTSPSGRSAHTGTNFTSLGSIQQYCNYYTKTIHSHISTNYLLPGPHLCSRRVNWGVKTVSRLQRKCQVSKQ